MDSGAIQGAVNQGDGLNTFRISAGTVAGAVRQGAGIDNFQMTGGTIQSLAQGDSHDVFSMSGGTIVGAFEDGDVATMTGGTIGRVDMKLDNNIFDMSGGRIIGNLVTGFGRDTVIVSGGNIGGNISVSDGDDSVTVTGGVISGEIRTSFGNDTFTWDGGGEIHSQVLMGDGDDIASISNLTEATLEKTPRLDGGLGNDQLTFANTTSGGAGRYLGWETVNLTEQSRFDLNGDFFVGDSGSGTGAFNIDTSSTLAVTQGSIRPYTAGQLATLNNAGTIDLTAGGPVAGDTLSVYGNYVGSGGRLLLQTVLGDDTSATDKLVVSQGAISGNTQLGVSNLSGVGGLTRNNGIEVVQSLNGATSTADAFALKGSLSAGAYQYYLFKGGVTAGTENNWYLRSSVVATNAPASAPLAVPPQIPPPTQPLAITAPAVGADEPAVEPPTAVPVAPATPTPATPAVDVAATSPTPAATTPALPQAVAGADPIALYRLEVPVYSVIVPAAQLMTLNALGTFHERQGEQSLLTETGIVPAGWARIYGSDLRKSWSGTASPRLDGSNEGYQIGHDLYAATGESGQSQRFGFFVGQSRLRGDVDGFAEGFEHRLAAKLSANVSLYLAADYTTNLDSEALEGASATAGVRVSW